MKVNHWCEVAWQMENASSYNSVDGCAKVVSANSKCSNTFYTNLPHGHSAGASCHCVPAGQQLEGYSKLVCLLALGTLISCISFWNVMDLLCMEVVDMAIRFRSERYVIICIFCPPSPRMVIYGPYGLYTSGKIPYGSYNPCTSGRK